MDHLQPDVMLLSAQSDALVIDVMSRRDDELELLRERHLNAWLVLCLVLQANIRALQATAGNVNAALERLLSNL